MDENSYNATILESILTQYKQQKDVFTNIAKTNPAALETAIAGLSETASEYKEISLSSGNQDEYTNYFYAVFSDELPVRLIFSRKLHLQAVS